MGNWYEAAAMIHSVMVDLVAEMTTMPSKKLANLWLVGVALETMSDSIACRVGQDGSAETWIWREDHAMVRAAALHLEAPASNRCAAA